MLSNICSAQSWSWKKQFGKKEMVRECDERKKGEGIEETVWRDEYVSLPARQTQVNSTEMNGGRVCMYVVD